MPSIEIIEINNQLMNVEKKMWQAKHKINDAQFLDNPFKKESDLENMWNAKNAELVELREKIQSQLVQVKNFQKSISTAIANRDPSNQNEMQRSINEKMAEIKQNKEKINKLLAISEDIKTQQAKFKHDVSCKEYKILYEDRELLQEELRQLTKTGIRDLLFLKNDKFFSFSESISDTIKTNPTWCNTLKQNFGFTPTIENPDGKTVLQFKSLNNDCIFLTNNTIQCDGGVTPENKDRVVPAMMALFLQSIDKNNTRGCSITEETPEMIKYMEIFLAKEISKRPDRENFRTFTINGKNVVDICRSNPDPAPAKPAVNEAPVHHQGFRRA